MHRLKRYSILALFLLVAVSALISAGQRGGQQAGGRGEQGGARGQRGGQTPAAPAATGLTVTGTVENYVPVTDAMLRNPDPGEWLMIRRDYHASDYSPLNQITRDNVKDLQ